GFFSSFSGPRIPVTDSGKVIIFDGARRDVKLKAFHLGAVRRGENKWDWLASPGGKFNVYWNNKDKEKHGDAIDFTGVFDDATDHTYGGNRVLSIDNQVIYGFHGEFWHQG